MKSRQIIRNEIIRKAGEDEQQWLSRVHNLVVCSGGIEKAPRKAVRILIDSIPQLLVRPCSGGLGRFEHLGRG